LQNRIRAILVSQGLAAPVGVRAWSELGLAGIAAHARPVAECSATELWRGRLHLTLAELGHVQELLDQAENKLDELAKTDQAIKILGTIPGVGPRTAETVVAFLPEPKRFRTTKQVSAYGGLVPRQYQSTDTDHRGRITKRGPRTLRKLLVECAWCMLRYNAWARAVYQRLTHGGKTRKKQAILALARKLLVRCWAMLRDGAAWHDPRTGTKHALPPSKRRRQAEAQQRRQAEAQQRRQAKQQPVLAPTAT